MVLMEILVSSQSVISSAEELPPDEDSRHRRSSGYLQEQKTNAEHFLVHEREKLMDIFVNCIIIILLRRKHLN